MTTTPVEPTVPTEPAAAPVPAAPPSPSTLTAAVAEPIPAAAEPKSMGTTLYPDGDAPVGDPPAEPAPVTDPPGSVDPAPDPAPIDPSSYTLTLPDGITLDEASMTEFKGAAAAARMTNDSAQSLLDLHQKAVTSAITSLQTAMTSQYTATQTAYKTEVDAMPEFQGESRTRSLQTIGRAIDEFGDPSVRTLFSENLSGDHPGLIRMILNMSKALVEGEPSLIGRPAQSAKPATLGGRLYPSK